MPTTAPRRRPKNRAELVLAEAVRLFAEQGFDGTSLAAIGRASGISATAVHRHFQSKEAMLVAAVERSLSRNLSSVADIVQGEGTPLERVVRLLRRAVETTLED